MERTCTQMIELNKIPSSFSLCYFLCSYTKVESLMAHQTQGSPLVSLAKPRMNVSLVKSPKTH